MQRFEAKEKVTQKMTRDGMVEVNQVTGEESRKSRREADEYTDPTKEGAKEAEEALRAAAKRRKRRRASRKAREAAKQAAQASQNAPLRLQFTDEERSDPLLSRYIDRAEDAADRLEKAKGAIPKQKRIELARRYDEATGRSKTRLQFREAEKTPDMKERASPLTRPAQAALAYAHGKVHEAEQENAGVEGAHKSEEVSERAAATARRKLKEGLRSHKMKPYRDVEKAEKRLSEANAEYLYQKMLREHPELRDTPLSHFYQKQQIKRQYARNLRKAAKAGGAAAGGAGRAAQGTVGITGKIKDFFAKHWKGLVIFLAAILIFTLISSLFMSCAALVQGGFDSILGTSYTAEDGDLKAVEGDYKELEKELRETIANIETDHPGYDEYDYELDEIGHDPFALASFLTAKLYDYTREEAQAELSALFDKQYTLTLTEEVQQRTRTNDDGEEETYDYYILHVKLTNKNITELADELLTEEQKQLFDAYMETKGNKPDVFGENIYTEAPGEYPDYEIPPEALSDERFAAMIAEAEKYLGYPYVWGGSSPDTSFDCSGFVCWVINHSGAGSVGRTTAQGIYNQTAHVSRSEAKPGDIIFFTGTYDSGSVVSHVGIYAGNGMMIHCGNPISYTSVNKPYWQQHFYAYGRLP